MFHIECMEVFADQTGLKRGFILLLSIITNQSRGNRRLFPNFGAASERRRSQRLCLWNSFRFALSHASAAYPSQKAELETLKPARTPGAALKPRTTISMPAAAFDDIQRETRRWKSVECSP
jgi:hypothetical protein